MFRTSVAIVASVWILGAAACSTDGSGNARGSPDASERSVEADGVIDDGDSGEAPTGGDAEGPVPIEVASARASASIDDVGGHDEICGWVTVGEVEEITGRTGFETDALASEPGMGGECVYSSGGDMEVTLRYENVGLVYPEDIDLTEEFPVGLGIDWLEEIPDVGEQAVLFGSRNVAGFHIVDGDLWAGATVVMMGGDGSPEQMAADLALRAIRAE